MVLKTKRNQGSRLLKNTGILYARLVLTVGISLYSTRLVLTALGAMDYGLYNLIAGLIIMLSFLNSAMAISTQRFLSFYHGKEDLVMRKKIFNNSLILHLIIGVGIVCLLEICGLFLFDGFLNIPYDRIDAAKSIYHFMSITVFFSILSVPFSASIISHEDIFWIAVINIVEVVLKLIIATALFYISTDRLIFYGSALMLVSIVSLGFYMICCFKLYIECKLSLRSSLDFLVLRELSSFAGWNLFGAACGVGKTHGTAIILNLFLGPLVNTAYGIANQVSAQMNFFSSAMLQAINPQIMSSEGAGDRARTLSLSMKASRFGFYLLAAVAIPCIFEMPSIILFWLGSTPIYTVIFCQLMLVGILINQLTIGLQSAIQAIGRIKIYQSVLGSVQLLNIPVSYILLKYHVSPEYVLVIFIGIEICACILRLYFLKAFAGLSISKYVNLVFKKILGPLIIILFMCLMSTRYFEFHLRFMVTFFLSTAAFAISVYYYGLEVDERKYVSSLVKQRIGFKRS